MSDAMQVAQQRRTDYKNAIAKKQQEIAELTELVADLDSFIDFGEALLAEKLEMPEEVSRPALVSQISEWDSDEAHVAAAQIQSKRTS